MVRRHGPFAVTQPWRVIGLAGIAALITITAVVGFVLLPITDRSVDGSIWSHICRAFGLGSSSAVAVSDPPALYPSTVSWNYRETTAVSDGDAGQGAVLALRCAACHGERGISQSEWIPSLAHMRREAVYKQLADFSSGNRLWPIMNAVARMLSPQDMRDLAAHFSKLSAPDEIGRPRLLAPGLIATGLIETGLGFRADNPIARLIYVGDARNGIAPYAACHGVEGTTRGAPVLAGQHVRYLQEQLDAFRRGARANDQGEVMRAIAVHLDDDTIARVSRFLTEGSGPALGHDH